MQIWDLQIIQIVYPYLNLKEYLQGITAYQMVNFQNIQKLGIALPMEIKIMSLNLV